MSSIFSSSDSFFITILFIALLNGALIKVIEGSLSQMLSGAIKFNKFITSKEGSIKKAGKVNKADILRLHEKYSFNPLYRIVEIVPFLIQLPFLIGIYFAVLNFIGFQNLEFLFIKDLSKPDNLIYNFNLLPFIMFTISVLIIKIEKKHIEIKDALIPFIFLIVLYNSPSSLIIYWILSQIIVFLLPTFIFSRKTFYLYTLLITPFFLIKLSGLNDIFNVVGFLLIILLIENLLKGRLKFIIIPILVSSFYVIYFHDALMIALYELGINYNSQPVPSMWRIHYSFLLLLLISSFFNFINEKRLKTFLIIFIIVLLINPQEYNSNINGNNEVISKSIKEKKHPFSLVLIVLDEYASPDELNGYLPTSDPYFFSKELVRRNWIVKNSFYSSSTFTNRSINSLFNYGEIKSEIDRDWTSNLIDLSTYYNSRLINDLKKSNNKIESYGVFNFNSPRSDKFLPKWEYENSNSFRNLGSFTSLFSFLDNSTLFYDILSKSVVTRIDNKYKIDRFREDVFTKFNNDIISENDFVYYHFHLPHSPFRYKNEFEYRGNTTEDYIEFWKFTSEKFSRLLLDLTSKVNTKIIVVGDHGFRSNKSIDPYNTFGAFYGFEENDLKDVYQVQDVGKLIKKYLTTDF
ncbi:YidC/Oxa1 family membrane protein insertase [Flavobacteriaceae bacterium]|nr:YidC/Oxa1 family membrane protein insertase [Flavobacteriaceae bacterium]MDC3297458.1 YidC/Oxa1 family membrane protein insertase [Flavobacteriaceae bacterium]